MPPLSLIVIAGATIIAIELILRLPFWQSARTLIKISRKAATVVASSRVSDHWKEKVLLRYSCILAGASARLAAMFLIVFVAVFLFAITGDFILTPSVSFLEALTGWTGIALASIIAVLYLFVRRHLVKR